MTSDLDERLRRVIAGTFRVPVEHIDHAASSTTIQGWDSVGQAELILAVETEFGIAFSPEDMVRMDSYEAIRALLDERAQATRS